MLAWIPITVMAAAAQTLRFMLQKHLKSTRLSATGATLARFLYSFPLVALILFGYAQASGQTIPVPGAGFYAPALVGAGAQIIGTLCVVSLFSMRNFAVGTTFMKTEVILSVPIGLLWLNDAVSLWALAAILVGLWGV